MDNRIIFFGKYRFIFIIGLLLIEAIILLLSLNHYFWLDGDNIKYALLGKDILNGHYRTLAIVSQPIHNLYWTGLPVLLTIPLLITKNSIIVMKFVPLISLLIALFFIFKYIEYNYGVKWGLSILFLMVVNPTIFTFGHTILTQSLFLKTLSSIIFFI